MARIVVSQCLLGISCRYDGKSKPCEAVLRLAESNSLIPVCPEQMGGLTTPRKPSERVEGRVLMNDGTDVTENYRRGAEAALRVAELNRADCVILKSKSPACGKGMIYDGSFSGTLRAGNGVAAQLLIDSGFEVISDEDREEALRDRARD